MVASLALACGSSHRDSWLVSGDHDDIAIRYGPYWTVDQTSPVLLVHGTVATDEDPHAQAVFEIQLDGSLGPGVWFESRPVTMLLPPSGDWSTVEDFDGTTAPAAWSAPASDGTTAIVIAHAYSPPIEYDGVLRHWPQLGHPTRIHAEWADVVGWIDLATGESAATSSGSWIGTFVDSPPASSVDDVYLEGSSLVVRDETGAETTRAPTAATRAMWMSGVILFDSASGLRTLDETGTEQVLDAMGCLPEWPAPTCAGCSSGRAVWETPCGSGQFVAASDVADAPTPIGERVLAVQAMFDGWLVVRGTEGATQATADLVIASRALPLGDVAFPDYAQYVDGTRPYLIDGDYDAGTATFSEVDATGTRVTAFERVHRTPVRGFVRGLLVDWDPETETGDWIGFDAITREPQRIAHGVPVNGARVPDVPGSTTVYLVITDADATGAGTLRRIDATGAVLDTYDDHVVAFAAAPLGSMSGVAYVTTGERAGVHYVRVPR